MTTQQVWTSISLSELLKCRSCSIDAPKGKIPGMETGTQYLRVSQGSRGLLQHFYEGIASLTKEKNARARVLLNSHIAKVEVR